MNMNMNRQRPTSVGSLGSLGSGGGGQQVVDYLKRMQAENPSFFYAIQTHSSSDIDNDHQDQSLGNANIFWADPSSRLNFNYFGDSVTFLRSSYKLPFAYFTGLNHHAQPVLFGCALLLHDSHSQSTFSWLFQTWLHAMSASISNSKPLSITTDPDPLLQLALSHLLPHSRHRFSKSAIFRDSRDRLGPHLFQSHPSFEFDFHKCINHTETIEEFDSSWDSLLHRYYLLDNQWLLSMYNARQHWVPVYLRDTFFGELSTINDTTPTSTSEAAFFDGYVTATTTIQMFLKQYEKAVAAWHEKELKADHDTTNTAPLLKTPSPMEKQAANLYTRRIFIKFQEELVETLANPATKIDDSGTVATYRVAKFGEDHRAHIVRFNGFEMKASCSCQMFEFSGIICRHILAVFRAKNVLTLPSQYLLKRWTRNAKSGGAGLDDHASDLPSNTRESLTVRFNNLRQEAIKYVEEGAKSIHVYNVAMDALQEASNKVAAAKNGSLDNGDMPSSEENHMTPYQSADEKEKKIRDLTAELENTNQRCEVYRANLLAVLKDMEDQKLKLAVKVQNARLSLKE